MSTVVLVWAVLSALASTATAAAAGGATVLTVTTEADDGPGSLRAAIAEANGTPGEDRIVFAIPEPGPFVIQLSSALVPTSSMVIDGTTQPGYAGTPVVTIDGGDRAQLVLAFTDSLLRLHGLSFVNAPDIRPEHNRPVAAVVVYGDLVVSRSWFTGNADGAVAVYSGRLSVEGSRFEGNRPEAILQEGGSTRVARSQFRSNGRASDGAAIHNSIGQLVVEDSHFSGNRANFGGAVANHGSARIVGSTFAGNVGAMGGAVGNTGSLVLERSTLADNVAHAGTGYGNGGALLSYGPATVTDSTFAGNEADRDGGAIFNLADLWLVHVTIADNEAAGLGGAVLSATDGGTHFANTLVTRNSGPSCSGPGVVDDGGNLAWFDTTCPGTNADPLVGPLQDNGGPTWTMLPTLGSPAIDAAELDACTATDQRRRPRPSGDGCDIGAVERHPRE